MSYKDYELNVGMEVHAELLTESKMFCGCSAHFGGPPNSDVCPVCLGLPGSLPVPNRRAIEFVARTAMALNCEISSPSIFQRKNYFYPDIPKGYQISQYGDDPIGKNGYLDFEVEGEMKRVRIRRVHLEEDTGKNMHNPAGYSEVDYNRSGVPLMEIVTEFPPDIHTPEEARGYVMALRAVLVTLGVCDGRMEEGSLRCEPNISVRRKGSERYGNKVELKNLNSFRAVYRGCEYEWKRQAALYDANPDAVIPQETRRWDDERGETYIMRTKEVEQEYRYFPEPDMVPMVFTGEWLEEQRKQLPELPEARRQRMIREYEITPDDAALLVGDIPLANWYEEAAKQTGQPVEVANWVKGDFLRLLSDARIEATAAKVTPDHLSGMLKLVEAGTINRKIAKTVFEEMFNTGQSPEEVVKAKGLTQIADENALSTMIDEVIAANPKERERFLAGEEKLKQFFVGQVMKASRGKANAALVNQLLDEKLK
ncbi:MAG: Asp-tRNA(Asn)/Glu-tRNA(Gln) amidotransferase subunit GatB [Armatimonadetes bacterium]|nr:Asp-tRNA(Asn)/Glu-tRNA(Gln) amidotransferase subunit GatB [Armatimonadota bacterium]